MLKVLLLFILLIAGIVLGPMLAGHQGYVLIQTDNYNIETSVTGLTIILILGVVVLFAIEWILRRIFRTGAHTRGWFVGRKRRRARKQTEQALLGARGLRIGRVPLGAADGGEQDGVGRPAGGRRLVGERRPVGVDRRAAERQQPTTCWRSRPPPAARPGICPSPRKRRRNCTWPTAGSWPFRRPRWASASRTEVSSPLPSVLRMGWTAPT